MSDEKVEIGKKDCWEIVLALGIEGPIERLRFSAIREGGRVTVLVRWCVADKDHAVKVVSDGDAWRQIPSKNDLRAMRAMLAEGKPLDIVTFTINRRHRLAVIDIAEWEHALESVRADLAPKPKEIEAAPLAAE